MTAAESTPRDTLYYDGQCSLCAGEIAELRERRGEQIALVDIHDIASAAARDGGDSCQLQPGATRDQGRDKDLLLRTLHLRKSDGSWLTGADANVAAWQGTRRGQLLRVLRWPLVCHIVDFGYRVWAWWRYRRLYGRQFEEARHAPARR